MLIGTLLDEVTIFLPVLLVTWQLGWHDIISGALKVLWTNCSKCLIIVGVLFEKPIVLLKLAVITAVDGLTSGELLLIFTTCPCSALNISCEVLKADLP